MLVLGVRLLVSLWKPALSLQLWRYYTHKCLRFSLLPVLFLYVVRVAFQMV